LLLLFGALLMVTAAVELTGLGRRMRFEGQLASVGGMVSGVLGGLVGNQGSIRSAALLGAHVPKDVFVGMTGTLIGVQVLRWIPETSFRRIVGVLLGLLGIAMVTSGLEAL
jgi:hypothetical protein